MNRLFLLSRFLGQGSVITCPAQGYQRFVVPHATGALDADGALRAVPFKAEFGKREQLSNGFLASAPGLGTAIFTSFPSLVATPKKPPSRSAWMPALAAFSSVAVKDTVLLLISALASETPSTATAPGAAAKVKGVSVGSATQWIGWDPQAKRVRSWIFDASGGFGEGAWTKDNAKWMVKTSSILQDGKKATATIVLGRVDANTLSLQSKDRTVDGKAVPDTKELMLKRR